MKDLPSTSPPLELPPDWWLIAQRNAKNLGLHITEYICLLIAEDDEPGLKSIITQPYET